MRARGSWPEVPLVIWHASSHLVRIRSWLAWICPITHWWLLRSWVLGPVLLKSVLRDMWSEASLVLLTDWRRLHTTSILVVSGACVLLWILGCIVLLRQTHQVGMHLARLSAWRRKARVVLLLSHLLVQMTVLLEPIAVHPLPLHLHDVDDRVQLPFSSQVPLFSLLVLVEPLLVVVEY